jgi:ribosome production factor 1
MREYDPSMLTAKPTGQTKPSTDSAHAADGTEASTSSGVPTPTSPTATAQELDDENAHDIAVDPFASYFSASNEDGDPIPPRVLITTSSHATKVAYSFCEELRSVVPSSEFIVRKKNKGFEVGRIAGWAAGRGYTSMLVVNEDRKQPSASPISSFLLMWGFLNIFDQMRSP